MDRVFPPTRTDVTRSQQRCRVKYYNWNYGTPAFFHWPQIYTTPQTAPTRGTIFIVIVAPNLARPPGTWRRLASGRAGPGEQTSERLTQRAQNTRKLSPAAWEWDRRGVGRGGVATEICGHSTALAAPVGPRRERLHSTAQPREPGWLQAVCKLSANSGLDAEPPGTAAHGRPGRADRDLDRLRSRGLRRKMEKQGDDKEAGRGVAMP